MEQPDMMRINKANKIRYRMDFIKDLLLLDTQAH
jgi:hypothetical protein